MSWMFVLVFYQIYFSLNKESFFQYKSTTKKKELIDNSKKSKVCMSWKDAILWNTWFWSKKNIYIYSVKLFRTCSTLQNILKINECNITNFWYKLEAGTNKVSHGLQAFALWKLFSLRFHASQIFVNCYNFCLIQHS